MFSYDRCCLHAVRRKWSFPRRRSGDGRVLVCNNFLGTRGITNRRHFQMGEVDRKKGRRRKEEGKAEQADGHYYGHL